ncbi:MAG: hypothetical protein COB84_02140 [Rhodobacteraceae bacterium]|nr:MAG: hypothetical protein COB84_02140 [Paracoccaceae bacterium]
MLLPTACQEVQTSKRSTFKGQYFAARGALESGEYTRASRSYKALLAKSGPLSTRLRLEYAHSLLRENKFKAAAQEARIISETEIGDARIAALAVRGTAEHEIARTAMARGSRDETTRNTLKSAARALDEVIKQGKSFDPLGSMAERRRIIGQELAQL